MAQSITFRFREKQKIVTQILVEIVKSAKNWYIKRKVLRGGAFMGKVIGHSYSSLISLTNLFQAWEEFKKGKRNKRDVQVFERNLEDNLFDLYFALKSKSYKHGGYFEFYVNDPKRRHIHKAKVSDRIVHHLLYKYLYDIFDKIFICDSYSCRVGKGTHRAVKRLEEFTRIVSKNYTQDCWALKLDIKKFFASVDHSVLLKLISKKVKDPEILWLVKEVINSFHANRGSTSITGRISKGIPLGNLTSQIFANIYLNELDQFIKHDHKIKHYLRYADDFIILDASKVKLLHYINIMKSYLDKYLKLELHPNKIVFRKLRQGIGFCGYVMLPYYILSRTKTKKRIFKKTLESKISEQSLQSYLGYFSHANTFLVSLHLKNLFWLK